MKKLISFILVLMLVVVMFSGCGETPGDSQTEETSGSQELNTDGMGDKLSAAYVDMMKNDEYLMKYKATVDFEGEPMELVATIAVSGEKTAMISTVDGMENTIISDGVNSYMIDHTTRTIFTMPEGTEDEGQDFETDGITYVGDGTEDGLAYEEYTTTDSTIKYYFDGKELVKMSVTAGGETIVMDIIEMSNNVPKNIFDVPKDYENISM